MAQPTTAKFGKMRIMLGDDAVPPVFAAACGFTDKGVTISKNLTEQAIPDCADEDAPVWLARNVASQTCAINGTGLAAAESLPDWDDAAMSTDPILMRVEVEYATGMKTIEGKFHVESEALTVTAGELVQIAISAQSDGPITATWVAAP